ncbi:MAG: hypothetical protein EHM45_01390 [Desulfobacteraceae bacterium]|nr:MAG: hypothetical protein EHM45_01390 [Desulfobacteraceae bacterium]
MSTLLQDLMNPEALPDETKEVKWVQTHISSVLITDHYAYKMKKEVNFGFLDFSTLEKRHYYCRREIELNQRLSQNIYLDVLPVYYDGQGHTLGKGRGRIVEYAVRMRRIPDEILMRNVFQRGQLQSAHLKDLAGLLSRFHATAEHSAEIASYGDSRAFKINTDENFAQTKNYIARTIDPVDYTLIQQWTDRFYREHQNLFNERKDRGKIRDCHGDLHMAHICLIDPIVIIDCIEFNERFRYSDTLADIAFLLMDLDFHGGRAFSDELWGYYAQAAGEKGRETLLKFYKVYRAYVRGKVIGFQLDDPHIAEEEKKQALKAAQQYFKLCAAYINEP